MSGRKCGLFCLFAVSLAIGASVAVIMLAEPISDPPRRLLLVTSSHGDQQAVVAGAEAAARERGVDLVVRTLTSTEPRRVTEAVASVLAEGVDGVIIANDATGDVARQLRKLGVQNIVTSGAAANDEQLLGRIGQSHSSAGRVCANLIQQSLPDGGDIVLLVDDAQTGPGAERLAGLIQSLKFANRLGNRWRVVEQLEDHGNSGDRIENLQSALASNPAVDFVIDLGDRREDYIRPLCELANDRRAKLITFDGSEEALAAVEAGELYAVIGENRYQQGFEAVAFLARRCRASSLQLPVPGVGGVNVPASVVRRENLARYRSQEFVSLTPAA